MVQNGRQVLNEKKMKKVLDTDFRYALITLMEQQKQSTVGDNLALSIAARDLVDRLTLQRDSLLVLAEEAIEREMKTGAAASTEVLYRWQKLVAKINKTI